MSKLVTAFGDTAYLMMPAEQGEVCIDLLEGRNALVAARINAGSVLPYCAVGPHRHARALASSAGQLDHDRSARNL